LWRSSWEQVKIPRYVDDQLSFLIWDFDEFIILIAVFCFGIMLGYSLMGAFAAWYAAREFGKTKGNSLTGRLEHIAFYQGLWDLNKKFQHGGEEKVYRK
jgi:type IV conjugative transfer system protein TraL